MKRILAMLVLVAACSGCDQRVKRAFFGSIKLGVPEWTNGVCMLPVELPTAIAHSAMWVSGVESQVDGSNIIVTARVTAPPRTGGKAYGGRVNLGKIKAGDYFVHYRDADGSVHGICKPSRLREDASAGKRASLACLVVAGLPAKTDVCESAWRRTELRTPVCHTASACGGMPCKLAEGPWALLIFMESVVTGWHAFHGASWFSLFIRPFRGDI